MMKHVMARHLRDFSIATFASKKKPLIDNKTIFNLTYGVFVLTAKDDKDNGCIINTCVQVASEPTRLMVSVQKGNYTRKMIGKSGKFNVSVLSDDVSFDVIRHFGMQSGSDVDKFAEFKDTDTSANGLKYITKNTNAFFSADVLFSYDLGSHVIFIGELTEATVLLQKRSCTYAHYHKAIKQKF